MVRIIYGLILGQLMFGGIDRLDEEKIVNPLKIYIKI